MAATGIHAMLDLRRECLREGSTLVLLEIHAQPVFALDRFGHYEEFGRDNVTAQIDDALNRARQILGLPEIPTEKPRVPEVTRDRNPAEVIKSAAA